MTDPPCTLVSDASLALDFLGRDTVARAGHQVHGKKPNRQFGARLVEDCSSARIDMMSAFLASIGAPRAHWMEPSASIANVALCFVAAMKNFHDLGQTRIVVWILDLELLKGIFGHGGYPYLRLRDSLLALSLVVKG